MFTTSSPPTRKFIKILMLVGPDWSRCLSTLLDTPHHPSPPRGRVTYLISTRLHATQDYLTSTSSPVSSIRNVSISLCDRRRHLIQVLVTTLIALLMTAINRTDQQQTTKHLRGSLTIRKTHVENRQWHHSSCAVAVFVFL